MAYLAAHTLAGTRKQANEDACCLEVAQTPLGEILMAIVCDGVGGLAKGDIASSTVINRFSTWFERELPVLVEGMVAKGSFDFALVQAVWGTHLQTMNELIRTYGAKIGARLGTTFTGMIVCNGHYLVAHVGDCRAYVMNAHAFEQITQDQTMVAKRLAAGEITPEEARRAPKNVILQSVGTERVVRPAFSEGTLDRNDLVVMCCDGAYHRAENEGIRKLFQGLDYRNEAALQEACRTLLQYDMDCGEKDNLTVICFSGDLAAAGEVAAVPRPTAAPQVAMDAARPAIAEDDDPTMVDDEEDLETMVGSGEEEDDLATMVDSGSDEDDVATMVAEILEDEDDAPTMVDVSEDSDDDLETLVEPDEDDLATMVESDGDSDDLPTIVEMAPGAGDPEPRPPKAPAARGTRRSGAAAAESLAPLATSSPPPRLRSSLSARAFGRLDTEPPAPSADEDDLATMVADDEDDAPTMVEGVDA